LGELQEHGKLKLVLPTPEVAQSLQQQVLTGPASGLSAGAVATRVVTHFTNNSDLVCGELKHKGDYRIRKGAWRIRS
jgi:hypothetical protein